LFWEFPIDHFSLNIYSNSVLGIFLLFMLFAWLNHCNRFSSKFVSANSLYKHFIFNFIPFSLPAIFYKWKTSIYYAITFIFLDHPPAVYWNKTIVVYLCLTCWLPCDTAYWCAMGPTGSTH
jgi:hypothetical protein